MLVTVTTMMSVPPVTVGNVRYLSYVDVLTSRDLNDMFIVVAFVEGDS